MIIVINSTSRASALLPPLQSRARGKRLMLDECARKKASREGLVCEKAVRLKIASGSHQLAKV